MANNLNVSIELGEKGATFAKYRVRVGVNSNESAWFGLIGGGSNNFLCVVNHNNTALRYVGYPEKARWDSNITDWSKSPPSPTPYYALTSGGWINPNNSPYGGANGYLIPRGHSYTSDWQTVSINRGNQRKGSVTISAGIRTYCPNDSLFGEEMVSVTLYTTEIPEAAFASDPQVTLTDTTLTISGSYTNPENYYKVKIYDGTTSIYTTPEGQTSYTYTINLTEAMYGTTKSYTVKLVGKDGTALTNQKTVSVTIPKRAFNIWMKQNGNINKDKKVYFKNVSNKEPKDIWVKKNNQIHKVKR